MDQKLKLIAIILGIFCLVALFFAFSYVAKYNTLSRDFAQIEKERQALRKENNSLAQKAANVQEELSRLKDRESNVKTELERLSSERDDLQKRFDILAEERDKLIERLQKALSERASVPVQESSKEQQTQPPVNTDQYWAGILKDKADLELQLANLKEVLNNNKLNMEELTKDKTNLELELEKMTKEKADTQRRLEYNEKMVDTLSLQLVREKDDKRKLKDQLPLLKKENYILRVRLKDTLDKKVSLEKKLKETEDKRLELYNQLNKMEQLLQDKLSAVVDVKEDFLSIKKSSNSDSAVELSPIVVSSAKEATEENGDKIAGSAALPDMSNGQFNGKVLAVNVENNFVVLDIGQKQGLFKGQILNVYQDSKQIATLEVIQVQDNVSAADIKEKTTNIKTGDIVK